MSRAVAADKRIALDAYYTPEELARFLVGYTVGFAGDVRGDVLEPHAGDGAFVRAIYTLCPEAWLLGCDLNPKARGLQEPFVTQVGTDFAKFVPHIKLDWILGNPPYRQAEEHVRHALDCAHNVGFLLRLGFLESSKRIPFWAEHPASHVAVLAERPSFTGGGTDSAAYGWFMWLRGHTGPTTLEVVSWKK